MASRDEFERAEARARARQARYPRAMSARYDAHSGKVVVALSSGVDIGFPCAATQGLERGSASDLNTIEISPSGYGLHFPRLDADVYIPALIEGAFGARKWTAARLGARGGKAKSAAKAASSRANGKLGGRPRKVPA